MLPRKALLTIYKSFICSHFDYGGVIYDQLYNHSFHAKLQTYQYKATFVMTGAIKGSSTEKLCHLRSNRWFRKLCLFRKIFKNTSTLYLFNLIPSRSRILTSGNSNKIRLDIFSISNKRVEQA